MFNRALNKPLKHFLVDFHSTNYKNILQHPDFYEEIKHSILKYLYIFYSLKKIIKIPLCFKNISNSIDLRVTSRGVVFVIPILLMRIIIIKCG